MNKRECFATNVSVIIYGWLLMLLLLILRLLAALI